ncbi:hypothetical protein Cgig2_013313 [Carnegiea gigantea]|uniref:Uncharacterized protein n=1 Tax=Carnegiea gigantea TaxID=171969 RepID=A0A9Q1GV19_9CARY|nr:hypothetical protein Cgig2_013313 [Carnegiea gigantea]
MGFPLQPLRTKTHQATKLECAIVEPSKLSFTDRAQLWSLPFDEEENDKEDKYEQKKVGPFITRFAPKLKECLEGLIKAKERNVKRCQIIMEYHNLPITNEERELSVNHTRLSGEWTKGKSKRLGRGFRAFGFLLGLLFGSTKPPWAPHAGMEMEMGGLWGGIKEGFLVGFWRRKEYICHEGNPMHGSTPNCISQSLN